MIKLSDGLSIIMTDPVLTSCKVTSVPNPITFESGLIYLADYSAKRMIKPKKKQNPEQPTVVDSDLPSPEIQFVDEFASPFSWFPKNGFTAYKITCEGPRASCEVGEGGNKNDGKKSEEEEEQKEGSKRKSNIVKLSDVKKSVLESARQRKSDPVSGEQVKRTVVSTSSQVQSVSSSQNAADIPSSSQYSSPVSNNEVIQEVSIHSSSTATPQKAMTPQMTSPSVYESSTPQVAQKQLLQKKVKTETFQLHKPSSLTNCASVSTLNSEIAAEEKVASTDQLGPICSKNEEEVPLSRGMSESTKPSDVTISQECGAKMGTAASYEFLLDW